MTRKFLQGLGIETEVIDQIMKVHGEGIENEKAKSETIRQEVSAAKSETASIKKEFDDFKASVDTTDWKDKYDSEVTAHAETKKTHSEQETLTSKKTLLNKHLTADGANPKLISLLEKEFDLSKIEVDGDSIKDWDNMSKTVKEQYADIFTVEQQKGHEPSKGGENKPSNVDYKAQLENARKEGNNSEAIRIKTEAAAEGIILI